MQSEKSNVALSLLAVAAVLAFIIMFTRIRLGINAASQREAELEVQIAQIENDIEVLKTEVERPFDKEYIEEIAHSYGYIYPQEVVYHRSDIN